MKKRISPFEKIYRSQEFNAHKNPVFPYIVDIELTNHCNLKCLFCGQQNMTRKKGFMPWEIFKKTVDECAEYGVPIRLIRWGEPFLHKDVIKFCKYVKEKGLALHITTNGLLLSEKTIREIVDIELDSIIFSFQGATKEKYQLMRNNNQYDKLAGNIELLAGIRGDKDKPFIQINSTMTDESKEEINGFKDAWLKVADKVGVGVTNLSRVSVPKEIKKHEAIKKVYRPCSEVYQKLSVDWDGRVSCCCSDWDRFMTVGDITKTTLKDIWNNSEELKIFRKLLDKMKHKSLTLCSVCFHTYHKF